MESSTLPRNYVPALGFDALTRFYDPIVGTLLRERTFKSALVRQLGLTAGMRLLDLGCGTGSLALMIHAACPGAEIVGLDGDLKVLSIARRKLEEAGAALELMHGLADAPPFPDGSFDRIVTSLVLHHLPPATRLTALRRARALLRPGGELHVADWGRTRNPLLRAAVFGVQLLDGFTNTRDLVAGRLPQLLADAGFEDVRITGTFATMFGRVALYRARP